MDIKTINNVLKKSIGLVEGSGHHQLKVINDFVRMLRFKLGNKRYLDGIESALKKTDMSPSELRDFEYLTRDLNE